jgi:AraC-like DNA-binding protein
MDPPRCIHRRHESALGEWELTARDAVAPLRPYVAGYQGYAERTAERPSRRRHYPTSVVPVIIELDAPLGTVDAAHREAPAHYLRAFAAGMHDRYAVTESQGAQRGMQINLTPLGARTIFGVPMHMLTNGIVGLDELLGPPGTGLVERLCAAPGWDERFALLDAALAARIAATPAAPAAIAWAWRRLAVTGGRAPVGEIAGALGWSRKQLVAEFREHIGLPPKTVARVLRFEHALRAVQQGARPNWLMLAYDAGYYDQSHFIRDFREFTGDAPSTFLRRLLPDRGGAID